MIQKSGKELFEERTSLIEDALNLREPDRVCNAVRVNAFPFYEYGVTIAESMNDFEKAKEAYLRYHREFQPDIGCSISALFSAKVLELMGTKILRWPGDKLGLDVNSTVQFIEYPTLLDDEYEEFFNDPAGFAFRKWLPRTFGVFEPFSRIDYADIISGSYMVAPSVFTNPELLDSYERLLETAKEQEAFRKVASECSKQLVGEGFPSICGGGSTTAFDMLGDGLRGTFGMMPDLLEQPENVKKACELFVKIHIQHSIDLYKLTGNKYQWVMLHKGFDNFIGDDAYKEFYWPYLQQWILALIDEGIVPVVFCEGAYNTRLKYLADVPKGKVIYLFEEINIREAKRILGDTACIMGGFPIYTLTNGTKQQIQDKVKEYMDVLAPGGGYLFSVSCSVDLCPRENMETLFEAISLYGKK